MIGLKLKQLRLSAGYDQQYLAIKTGISQPHISHIESGKRTPSIEVLEIYATFFNKESIQESINKIFE